MKCLRSLRTHCPARAGRTRTASDLRRESRCQRSQDDAQDNPRNWSAAPFTCNPDRLSLTAVLRRCRVQWLSSPAAARPAMTVRDKKMNKDILQVERHATVSFEPKSCAGAPRSIRRLEHPGDRHLHTRWHAARDHHPDGLSILKTQRQRRRHILSCPTSDGD